MIFCCRILLTIVIAATVFPVFCRAQSELDYGRDIRPVLAENCFFCHGQDSNKRQADLRLDVRQEAIDAGVIVPSDADSSALVDRINSDDPDLIMPPRDSNRRLSSEQKQLLARWIDEDAPYSAHWAFVAPELPFLPKVKNAGWVRNQIDRFVLAKLESSGLEPSPEADRATLIKRLAIDLTGLPPTPEEVDRFFNDEDPLAYEKLVDQFLASPHYGERVSLPWLDAARYADSNGFQQDGDTWQWMWRDWMVSALNEDLPFDQFTIWQLAGDLLPDATNDQKIASAFNRNHLLNGEGGAIAEEQRFVVLFDRVDTTATTWLGLTIACAQCHDHKYDPTTQNDYYSLMDLFNRVPEVGTPQTLSPRIRVDRPYLELPTEESKREIAGYETKIAQSTPAETSERKAAYVGWRAGFDSAGPPYDKSGMADALIAILNKPAADRTDEEKKQLENGLQKHFDDKVFSTIIEKLPAAKELNAIKNQLEEYRNDRIPRVMVMSDDQPRETHVLMRGEYLSPLEKVSFTTPSFLPPLADTAARNRLGFAQWLVAPENPLTARVQVNRMWQYFFGTGLVKTSEDFGLQSEYPVHRELLDWLALEFQSRKWSMKTMHRLIVTSATYRQSSRTTKEHLERDSENRLLARFGRTRMPAMILRDWALAAAGLIDSRIGGAPVYPYQPEAVWESLAITKERDFTYPKSIGSDLYRRSLYTFWRRTVSPANMFDASSRQACRVRSSLTSTPLHALTTLNDPTWVEAARCLAERSMKEAGDPVSRLTIAFRRVLCRIPSDQDIGLLRKAYEKQLDVYENDSASAVQLLSVGTAPRDEALNAAEHAALTAVCLAIMNLDEAVTRE